MDPSLFSSNWVIAVFSLFYLAQFNKTVLTLNVCRQLNIKNVERCENPIKEIKANE